MTDPFMRFVIGVLSGFQLGYKKRKINQFFKYLPGVVYCSTILIIVINYDKTDTAALFCLDLAINLITVVLWYHSFDTFSHLLNGIQCHDTRFQCMDTRSQCINTSCDTIFDYCFMVTVLIGTIYCRGQKWPNGLEATRAILTFLVRIYFNLIPILFKKLMDSLVYRFNHLSAKLELAATGNVSDDEILTCCEAHTGLVDLVELLNASFGLQMLYSAILHFSLVLMFIIDTHHLLLFVNFVYIARLFYTINATADKLLSASESSLDQLSINRLHGLSQSTLFQIEVWMLQFASSKAEVSFASFITLSKSAYVSMVLAATTYAILILQLMASNRSPQLIRMIRGFVVHL